MGFGSGCPEGSIDIISSTDGQTVSVIQGFAVGVFSVDYRGYAVIPSDDEGSYTEFTAEYFFAGKAGPQTSKTYNNGYIGEIELTDEVDAAAIVYSECGSNTIFRINTAIRANKDESFYDDVFIEVDSTDTTVKQAFRYNLSSRPC